MGSASVQDDGTRQLAPPPELRREASREGVASVIVYDGDEIGALHSLTKDETVFGRTADSDIVLPETRVSRRHALIRRTGAGPHDYEIVDLASTNGTFLNGEPVERAALHSGDKILIGGSTLKFAVLDRQDLAYQSRIVEMIHVDDLTGLLTKRSFMRALEKELVRAERYTHPLSVLMMDLDHFKQVNDTHGHLVGSHCLAEVGRIIREATRTVDVNGRYGGEEFCSFLPETDGDEASVVAERVREAVGSRWFRHHDTLYQVRISIGIAFFPTHGRDVESLIHSADLALYRAKSRGRNRVELHETEPATIR